jgi:hypothetical protein
MDTTQQFIRIVLYHVGAYFFGDAIASGEIYQAAIGGAVSVVAFGWWFWQNRKAG